MRAADRVSVKDLQLAATRLIELVNYDETDESAVALRKVGRLLAARGNQACRPQEGTAAIVT